MSQNISLEAVFGQVQQSLTSKKYYQALRQLSSVSLQASNDITFLSYMSETQKALQDFNALSKTQKVLVKLRGEAHDHLNLMETLYKLGKRNEALDIGLQLQNNKLEASQEHRLSLLMSKIYLEENDFEGAQEVLVNAVMSESDDFMLWAQGVVYLNNDQKAHALEYFRKAVQANPKNDQAWVSLGMMHKEMGDEDLFTANIEKAIDINPYNTAALKLMATAAVKNVEKSETAFERLRFYLSEYSFDGDMSLCHIQMLCQQKQWDLAELEVEKLIQAEPLNEVYKNIKKSMFDAQIL